MSSSDLSLDEEMIARELKKVLAHDLPAASPEEKKLYQDLESRIATAHSKMIGDGKGSAKKKSLKAKILAASSLARSRDKTSVRPPLDTQQQTSGLQQQSDLQAESRSQETEIGKLGELATEKIKAAYNISAPGDIRKQLEEDGSIWAHGGVGSDSDEEENCQKQLAAVTGHSPLEKLQRSVRKAQLLARATGAGDAESDEEIRALTQESEAWLKKQKDLERQLLATSGKNALRNKYMNKELDGGSGVGPTDREIEELFERVVKAPDRGKSTAVAVSSALTPGGKPRQDMADVVRRAMALRAEAAKSKGRTPTNRRSARRAFPVQLDEDEEDGKDKGDGSSADDLDEEEEDDMEGSGTALGIPDLITPSDSSEDELSIRQPSRNAPRFSLRHRSSLDLGDVDDVLAIESAKRQLGAVRAPKLAKGDPLSRSFDTPSRAVPRQGAKGEGKTPIALQPRSSRPELGRPLVRPPVSKTLASKGAPTVGKVTTPTTKAAGGAKNSASLTKQNRLGSAKLRESVTAVVNAKRITTVGSARPILRSEK